MVSYAFWWVLVSHAARVDNFLFSLSLRLSKLNFFSSVQNSNGNSLDLSTCHPLPDPGESLALQTLNKHTFRFSTSTLIGLNCAERSLKYLTSSAREQRRTQSSQYVLTFLHYLHSSSTVCGAELIGNKCPFWNWSCRGREREDVYLALFRALTGSACSHYITLQLPSSSSLGSREGERRRTKTEREKEMERKERDKTTQTKQRGEKNGESVRKCAEILIPFFFILISPYVHFQRAAAERGNAAGPRRFWFRGLCFVFGSEPALRRACALPRRIDPDH